MERLYRLFLSLYPRDFRERYGEALLETWRARRREVRRTGRVFARARFHLRELVGVAAGALRQRIEDLGPDGPGQVITGMIGDGGVRALRLALRRLARSPGFTAAAVLTLALAIGANTAIYSVVKGVVLDPLPYPEAERVAWIDHAGPGVGADDGGLYMTRGLFHFYRENARTLEEVAIYRTFRTSLTGDGSDPVSVGTLWTTWTLFPVLGLDAARGRVFGASADGTPETGVAVLTHEFWELRYGSDPDVLGRSVRLDGTPYEIVGVLPPGTAFPGPETRVIIPRSVPPMSEGMGGWVERGVGRMAQGASPADVERELRSLVPLIPTAFGGQDFARRSVEDAEMDPRVSTLKAEITGDVEGTLWILMGTVGIVLLVACANVANLFLVRANTRRREVAVRRALGGGRAALVRLFLSESLVLAVLGGGLGLAVAVVGLDSVLAIAPPGLPRLHEVGIDGPVLAFTVAVSLGAAVAFGTLPLLGSRASVVEALKDGGRGTAGRTSRAQNGLVVAQVALALVLVVGSGLTIESFRNLRDRDPGFVADDVLTFQVGLDPGAYPTEVEQAVFHAALLRRLEGLPGVERAGAVGCLPLRDCSFGDPLYRAEETYGPDEIPPIVRYTTATPGYFEALGIGVVAGRALEARDHEAPTDAVVVSRSLARRFWPGEEPLGRRIRVGIYRGEGEPEWHRIVGVVGDVRSEGLTAAPTEHVYFPMADRNDDTGSRELYYAVKAGGPPGSLVPAVRRELGEMDASIPLARVDPMERILDRAWAPARFTMTLLVLAGGTALVLGLVGIYGVVSYVVSLRRSEIGLRMALGAGDRQVRGMVLRRGAGLATLGAAIGLLGALAVSRVLDAVLFEVSGTDPVVYASATLLLLGVSLAAVWLPARRATRTDPMEVLRTE